MSHKSKIEWTEATWNPIAGCTKCSPGCENCYAERRTHRLACMGKKKYMGLLDAHGEPPDFKLKWFWNNKIRCDEKSLDKPLHWKKPCKIFVCSMSDLFHKGVPFEFIDKVYRIMRRCPQHTFQILTKRPARMKEYITGLANRLNGTQLVCMLNWENWPLFNVHLGVSISTPDELWKADTLRQIPAAVRYISFEPLLADMGEIDLKGIDWVIIGCESMPGGRAGRFREKLYQPKLISNVRYEQMYSIEACNRWIEAARNIITQCKTADILVFVKQIPIKGRVNKKMSEWPTDLQVQESVNKCQKRENEPLKEEWEGSPSDSIRRYTSQWGLPKGF